MSGEATRLGPLEAQVMDVLWIHGPGTIRQVITHLEQELAYTTIATVLGNLQRKALVRPVRGPGRSVSYQATTSREQHAARLMGQALEASGDRALSIQHFVQGMDAADMDLLRRYLAEPGPEGAQ